MEQAGVRAGIPAQWVYHVEIVVSVDLVWEQATWMAVNAPLVEAVVIAIGAMAQASVRTVMEAGKFNKIFN